MHIDMYIYMFPKVFFQNECYGSLFTISASAPCVFFPLKAD